MPPTTTCACKSKQKSLKTTRSFPYLTGLLIAILPKCPFCVLAYSSAITMCGSASPAHTPEWTSYVSIFLAALTCVFLLLNYRGTRTIVALMSVVLGGGLILWSELVSGLIQPYYWGTFFLLMGVWINGSFLYVFRKFLHLILPKSSQPI